MYYLIIVTGIRLLNTRNLRPPFHLQIGFEEPAPLFPHPPAFSYPERTLLRHPALAPSQLHAGVFTSPAGTAGYKRAVHRQWSYTCLEGTLTLGKFSGENPWAGRDASTTTFPTMLKKVGNQAVWFQKKFSTCMLALFLFPGWTCTQIFLLHTLTS